MKKIALTLMALAVIPLIASAQEGGRPHPRRQGPRDNQRRIERPGPQHMPDAHRPGFFERLRNGFRGFMEGFRGGGRPGPQDRFSGRPGRGPQDRFGGRHGRPQGRPGMRPNNRPGNRFGGRPHGKPGDNFHGKPPHKTPHLKNKPGKHEKPKDKPKHKKPYHEE